MGGCREGVPPADRGGAADLPHAPAGSSSLVAAGFPPLRHLPPGCKAHQNESTARHGHVASMLSSVKDRGRNARNEGCWKESVHKTAGRGRYVEKAADLFLPFRRALQPVLLLRWRQSFFHLVIVRLVAYHME